MQKNILHISDLHLNNYLGDDEYLRKGFYKEYLQEFVTALETAVKKIDFVMVTGDLIDVGKTENFSFVSEIIDHLLHLLKLSPDRLATTIGNHDYPYKSDDGINSLTLRKPFRDFADRYVHKASVATGDRFSIHKIDSEMFLLALDPTLDSSLATTYKDLMAKVAIDKKSETRNKPGKIGTTEIDEIINALQEHVSENALLLVGCHYPIEKFTGSALYQEEEDFDNKHVWNDAAGLRVRINKIRTSATCWFFGDTHAPDAFIDDEIYYIMTGRFGTSVKKFSEIPRQAKLLKYDSEKGSTLITISTKAAGHSAHPSIVSWETNESRIRKILPIDRVSQSVESIIPVGFTDKIMLLSNEIEQQIIGKITEQKLYSFGRFRTSKNKISLGWIAINPLLNSGKILPSIIAKCEKHLIEKLCLNASDSLILGLEFWGAIVGSQLSIGTGISCCCLPTKGNGQFHAPSESNKDLISSKIPKTKSIVLIIDVVSCGDTINRVISNIEEVRQQSAPDTTIDYHVISVIANANQFSEDCANLVATFGTFCKNLKIPIVNDDVLPDETLIPYDVDLLTD